MKKVILILVLVSLFSMAACGGKDISKGISIEPNDASVAGSYANYDYRDKDAREEAIYRREYVLRLSEEPEELARFLLATHKLNEFVEVDTEDRSRTVENAVVVFSEDEGIHREALVRAKDVFAEMHIDCDWQELRKIAPRSDDFATYEEYRTSMEQDHPTLTPPRNECRDGR